MQLAELLLERHPDEMVMYHGTSGMVAERIAKKGLIARPPSRHYEAEEDPHLASLTGTYFTNKLSVALGYAYKASYAFEMPGSCAVIMARVPLTQAVPDEDVVTAAMDEAKRQTRDPDAFARAFHRNLVQDRPIPMRRDMLLKVRDAYAALDHAHDDDVLLKSARLYRRALDQVTRAYAAMVFDTHPVYLGGNHTVRLPRGLPLQNILSVTEFEIEFPEGDVGVQATYVKGLLGQAIPEMQLQAALDELQQRDFF